MQTDSSFVGMTAPRKKTKAARHAKSLQIVLFLVAAPLLCFSTVTASSRRRRELPPCRAAPLFFNCYSVIPTKEGTAVQLSNRSAAEIPTKSGLPNRSAAEIPTKSGLSNCYTATFVSITNSTTPSCSARFPARCCKSNLS